MPLMTVRDRQAYRADDHKNHSLLDEKERQRMLKVGTLYPLGLLFIFHSNK